MNGYKVVCCPHQLSRRNLLKGTMALGTAMVPRPIRAAQAAVTLPSEVAGIAIPQSRVALQAAAYSRASCPDYLFNHCMRTFLFGALFAKKQSLSYNADQAFVAAALHDMGLLRAFESKNASFEIDGANAAESFATKMGLSATEADVVWHSVAFHDGRWAVTKRAGHEAMLVSAGAGADVDGPDTTSADSKQIADVLAAFPRLQFKRQFTALLIGHCKRKPTSQASTWLEGLCREQAPSAWQSTTEQEIAGSGYAE